MMRWLLIGMLVVFGPGCAQKTDWVEGTLVTVDVTGAWKGRMTPFATGGRSGEFELTLTQRGPKVTGEGRMLAQKFTIEGTVRGDVLSFSEPGGRLRAQATVTGDDMSGEGHTNVAAPSQGQPVPFRFSLAR
jgi:hypothetical protein